MKKKIFIISLILIMLITVVIGLVILKPKYELNKAIDYIKSGDYIQAYDYIESTDNEKNKQIVKELITTVYLKKSTNCSERITYIANEATSLLLENNITFSSLNIDYSLDDNITIMAMGLDEYVNLKNKIKDYMILSQLNEYYNLNFCVLEDSKEFFTEFLYNLENEEQTTEKMELIVQDSYKMATLAQSFADNYVFLPETKDILEEIDEYL